MTCINSIVLFIDELTDEKMGLSALHFEIIQTHVHSHSIGSEMWTAT